MLKATAPSIPKGVKILFNKSIKLGVIPQDWKKSLVVPVPKDKDTSEPSNHRPISLLSILSKLVERHLYKHVLKHTEAAMPLVLQQWGFRQGRSTTSALIDVTHKWLQSLDLGKEVCTVFFDLRKAFDSVPHRSLLEKLKASGINGHILSWLFSYLLGREQSVVLDGKTSSTIPVLSGDDLLLHREIKCIEDYSKLQQDVNKLASWVDDNKLTLNSKKCKYMIISRLQKKSIPNCAIQLSGQPLERVRQYKYLGVVITEDLTWSTHISKITSKARKVVGLIYRQFYSMSSTPSLLQLYISLVRPHLEYASPVWDPFLVKDIQKLESVQKLALKMCRKTWDSSYADNLQLFSLPELSSRRKYLSLSYFYNLINGQFEFPDFPATL